MFGPLLCVACFIWRMSVENILATYSLSIGALGFVAALMLIQIVISDAIGIMGRHVPGTPVEPNHALPMFRASRTVANTNESVAIFIAGLLFCILMGASASLTAVAAWGYALARLAYAICYYANLQTLRSICFGVSLLALFTLLIGGAFF